VTAGTLLDLLCARSGLVCTVGAGGKKSALYRLAAAHPGRLAITSTVFIPPFPKNLDIEVVRAEPARLLAAVQALATKHRRIAYTGVVTKKGRFEGVPAALVRQIHECAGFDVTLIKADGARTRLIKAPGNDEPQIPSDVTTVIPVISAQAIGQPLSERIAHRPETIERITGARLGQALTPTHIARLLASEEGLLKGVGTADVVPLINMCDDAATRALAVQAAEQALGLTNRFSRVVLGSMRAADAIVDVVEG
jgi:probable selenium-dependent hydroxylase accessory protein YqeC